MKPSLEQCKQVVAAMEKPNQLELELERHRDLMIRQMISYQNLLDKYEALVNKSHTCPACNLVFK